MKPEEFKLNGQRNLNNYIYSDEIKLYKQYKDTDCVIAYRKCFMGIVFIIKGRKNMFGFQILNEISSPHNNPHLQRRDIVEIQKLFNEKGADKIIVIDKEKFKIFERKVLLENI